MGIVCGFVGMAGMIAMVPGMIMANVSSYDVISACETHYLAARFPTKTTQEKYKHE